MGERCPRLDALPALAALASLALAMTSFAPVARADMGGPAGVAALNRLRAASGIPPVKEDPALSKGCRLHDIYMSEHQNLGENGLIHSEQPGLKGYTNSGAHAAEHAVLAKGFSGWDPWYRAPYHLATMLAPYFAKAGFYQTNGYSCLAVDGFSQVPSANSLYTYPGDGNTSVPSSEVTFEIPDPTVNAGLPAGAKTGPQMIVMADGPWTVSTPPAKVVNASLAPANGSAAHSIVRLIQGGESGGSCTAECAIIIPVKPLLPETRYHASVTVAIGKTRLTHDWYFTTSRSTIAAKSTPAKKEKRPASHGRISRLALSRQTVRAGLARVQVGYRLSGASRLVVELKRPTPDGVATGTGLCVSPHYRGTAPTAPSCTYWQTVAKTSSHVSGGAHRASLRALLHRKTLAPGRYRLTVHAAANANTVAFTVER